MKGLIHFLTLMVIFQLLHLDSFAQSKFAEGFSEGYKKGYCNEKTNCIPPIPPIAPLPTVYEKSDSYQDGYNRGFKMGLEAQNVNTSVSSQGYKTASAAPTDYIYKPTNSELQQVVAENRHLIFKRIIERAQEYYNGSNYNACIKACADANNITHLVSKRMYLLLAESYEELGKKGKANKYYRKAEKMK